MKDGGGPGVLHAVVRSSIRFRGVVIALASLLLGYGLYSLRQAKYDVFPEFAPPQVVIQTEAPGLSPEQVEVLVTQPIENALTGAAGLVSLRSASIQGLSLTTVTFDPRSDLYRDRQFVAERIASMGSRLPQGVLPPAMTPLTSSTSVILIAGLTSTARSLMDLRTIADWTVRPRLLAVEGVSNVSVFGGERKQIQIRVRPDRLVRFNLGMNDVTDVARRATGLRGGGFVTTANQRIVLQTEGQSLTPGEVARTVLVHHEGAVVTMADVADVAYGPEPPFGAASIMGRTGVALVVSEQYGANTLEVTKRLERAFEELRPTLRSAGVSLYPALFRPANFIETSVRNVRSALFLGGLLVVAVLFLFLFDLRTAAISCAAIPLSLLAAVMAIQRLGLNLNTMTLGGLAIAIGEVVDDAVIDVENIVRRLRLNRRLGSPRPAWRVVLDASLEVRGAIVYATLAVILVFFPVLSLSGAAGRLFSPLAIAYILSVLASLVVAVSVTPALSMAFLGTRELSQTEPPVTRWLKARYRSLLAAIERRPRRVIAGATLLLASGLAALPFFGAAFLPELKEGHFIIHMWAVPGTSLDESIRIGGQVTRALLALPTVRWVSQRAGRAEAAEDVLGTHSSELNVDLKPLPGEEAERALSDIRKALAAIPGVNFSIETFLTERMEETLSGYAAPVVVNVFGNDLALLDRKAQKVARLLEETPGATGVQIQSLPAMPQLSVRLRRADLERWGFTPVEVLEAVHAAYQGEVVGQVYEGSQVFDVSVMLDPHSRSNVADVAALPFRNAEGTYVRLGQLADVLETTGRYQVLHEGARRVETVTCGVAGRDVASFVRDAKRRVLSRISLPPGSYIDFAGTAEEESRSRRDLLVHTLLAGAGILLLLSIVTAHWRNLLLILANLPFALVGGVLAVFATGGVLSLGSMVGFVTLFGITLRNSIMMISHFERLVAVEGRAWGLETAIEGATDRLAPIMMTSLVTALGLLPLALGREAPGREIEGPLALVILGGLMTSMILNLLLLPTLALRFGRFGDRSGERGSA